MQLSITFRLSLLQFLQYFVWGSWFVTAGNYWLNGVHYNGREVGSIYASVAIAASISPFVIGALADRFFSAEKLLGILHILGSVLLLAISNSTTYSHTYTLVLLYMLCYLPTFSLSNALCFHHIADAKNDFPRIRVWGTISWIIAGLLVGFKHIETTPIPFKLAAMASLVHGIYCFTLPNTPPKLNKHNTLFQNLMSDEMKLLLKEKNFIILIASIGLICIPSSFYYSFVNPFLNEIGMHNAAGKMAIGQVTEIIIMLALPFLFKNMRLKIILAIGLFLWGIRYGLFIIGIESGKEYWHLISLAIHGIAFTCSMFVAQIYLDTRVPVALKSTAQGFYSFLIMGVMALIGSYIAGETVYLNTNADGSHHWQAIWIIPTVIGVISAFFFLVLFKGKEKA